jgi:hypothetical protein
VTEVGWEPGLEKMPDLGMWVRALEGDGMMVEPGMIGIVVNQFRSRTCWDDVMPVVRWDDAYQCVYPLHNLALESRPKGTWQGGHASCGQTWTRPTKPEDDPGDRFPWLKGSAA